MVQGRTRPREELRIIGVPVMQPAERPCLGRTSGAARGLASRRRVPRGVGLGLAAPGLAAELPAERGLAVSWLAALGLPADVEATDRGLLAPAAALEHAALSPGAATTAPCFWRPCSGAWGRFVADMVAP